MDLRAHKLAELKRTLKWIEKTDGRDYDFRNKLVFKALYLALDIGFKAGVRIDPSEPKWPVVYIELPNDTQVSWHVPEHEKPWDGHTTEEKYRRICEFIDTPYVEIRKQMMGRCNN